MDKTTRTARACSVGGLPVTRTVSAFCGADVINACRSLDARFSVTVRMNASARDATARIGDDAWTRIEQSTTD